ncbi:ATP-binding protein [Candidatus Woesearchaeota archaeon]|nr:ATP-binding protein [Candidatus Woesearchaeota archaeon]
MPYVEREIADKFRKLREIYGLIAVVGARQAGKTTFLKEQMKQAQASYVLFDDPDAQALFEDIKKFQRQYCEGFEVTLLDEVQYCQDAGRKLKYLADTGKKIWMTSSSEILLGKDILSYLVGRVSILRIYPFSITEFLAAMGQKETAPDLLRRAVWEHINYGGYPKVVMTEDAEAKKTILRDLYETMIFKDVARTFSIEDIRSLEEFSKYLSLNIGGAISHETISRNIKISFQTTKKYLDALEKSYIIVRVQPFHTNKAKEIAKQPKLYFLDTGLRNSVAKTFGAEPDGKLFENYVLSELLKAGAAPKYWRTKSKAEVDFILEKEGEVVPIEVNLNAEPGRIERSLHSFIAAYNPRKALVISYKGEKGWTQVDGCRVIFTDALEMRKHI